jgi:hypothetical protein
MSTKDTTSLKDAPIQSVVPSESTMVRVLSQEDNLVADLTREQPTLEQISQMTVTHRVVPNLMAFPEEVLAKHGKEYHFVWLTKDKNLSVKLRTDGWVLCNRTNSPYIKPHRFGTHGALEQSGMLLAFLPKDIADEKYMQPVRASQAKVKYYTKDIFDSQDKSSKIQFYKPENKGGDNDD